MCNNNNLYIIIEFYNNSNDLDLYIFEIQRIQSTSISQSVAS